jgi:hypothetical protein
MTKPAILMIHGRAQGRRTADAVRGEWIGALRAGLGSARAGILDDVEIRFPFYGKKLDELTGGMEEAVPENLAAKGDASDAEQDYLTFQQEIVEQILTRQGITPDQQARMMPEAIQERGPGSWPWVQSLLRGLDRIPGLSSAALSLVLRDVYLYLSYPKVRKAINDIVAPTIGGDCIVISHSLGSVVAYDLLKPSNLPADGVQPIRLLLTLGSPLGVGPIRQAMMPLKFPASVRKWKNAFDRGDVVALYALDKMRFAVTPAIGNDDSIENGTENHHGITEYLNKPSVAELIYDELQGST